MATQAKVDKLLEEQEIRLGMPKGLMRSIWQQETSGREKWLKNPKLYHYPKGKDGIRRTKGGTISTAFGPFGILDSTAKKPGYGVKPLQNKSLEEQIRFSAEYAAGRAKYAGTKDNPDWFKGVANYGEGTRYAEAVFDRISVPDTPASSLPNLWEDPTRDMNNIAATTRNRMAIEQQYASPFESIERYAQEQPQSLPILAQNEQANAMQMAQATPQAGNSWLSFLSTMFGGQAPVQAAQPSISAQELDFLAQQILEGNY